LGKRVRGCEEGKEEGGDLGMHDDDVLNKDYARECTGYLML
jgi:hypothetical protein